MRRVLMAAALAWIAAGCKSTSQPTDPFLAPTRVPQPTPTFTNPQGQAYDPNAGAVPALPPPPTNGAYDNSPVYNPPGGSFHNQYPGGTTAPSTYPAPPSGATGFPARSSSHVEPARLPMALRGRGSADNLPEPINLDEPPPNASGSSGVQRVSHSEAAPRDIGLRARSSGGDSIRVVEPGR